MPTFSGSELLFLMPEETITEEKRLAYNERIETMRQREYPTWKGMPLFPPTLLETDLGWILLTFTSVGRR